MDRKSELRSLGLVEEEIDIIISLEDRYIRGVIKIERNKFAYPQPKFKNLDLEDWEEYNELSFFC